jgi:hypothetical protein
MLTSGNFEGKMKKHTSAYAVLKKNQKISMLRQQVRFGGGVIVDADTLNYFPVLIRSADETTWSKSDSACNVYF